MIRSQTRLAVALLMFAAVGTSTAQAVEIRYERYQSEAGRFSVLLPSQPMRQTKPLGDGFVEYAMFARIGLEHAFGAKCLEVPERFVAGKDPQQLIAVYRNGSRKGKTIVDDEVLTLGQMQSPAREYRLEAEPGFYVRERLILVGTRLYTLYIGAEDKAFLDSAEANRFFDSFVPAVGP
jgi:hypothetical protein